MTLLYSMVFTLLMAEASVNLIMIIFIALILPLPAKWRKGTLKFLAQSPLMGHVQYVMKIVFMFVCFLFADSVKSVVKVVETDEHSHHHDLVSESTAARRFYAQRNMYLTGFTLFLSLILNRTFFMILDLLQSEDKLEAIKNEATLQSKDYERVLESETKLKKEVKELSDIVAKHEVAKRDLDNLKKQTKQQQDEYIRLANANNEMEMKLKGIESETKKDI
ncbi:hypothetical protein FBU30_003980 [Linnemannia zychae]|nr:hypothetical protein FBU30_003980 [Linnemannia zychae]